MRKLIVQEWMSLDGYVEDQFGKLDYFEKLNSAINKYSNSDQLDFMKGIDAIVLGRKTYELFIEFWPTATTDDEVIADALNKTPKYIVSNSLKKAPWGKWEDAKVLSGDAVEAIKKLKTENGKNIVLWGSIQLVQSLFEADLIDELHIQLCSTVTGGGRALFPNSDAYKELKLIGLKEYENGIVWLKYSNQS